MKRWLVLEYWAIPICCTKKMAQGKIYDCLLDQHFSWWCKGAYNLQSSDDCPMSADQGSVSGQAPGGHHMSHRYSSYVTPLLFICHTATLQCSKSTMFLTFDETLHYHSPVSNSYSWCIQPNSWWAPYVTPVVILKALLIGFFQLTQISYSQF